MRVHNTRYEMTQEQTVSEHIDTSTKTLNRTQKDRKDKRVEADRLEKILSRVDNR